MSKKEFVEAYAKATGENAHEAVRRFQRHRAAVGRERDHRGLALDALCLGFVRRQADDGLAVDHADRGGNATPLTDDLLATHRNLDVARPRQTVSEDGGLERHDRLSLGERVTDLVGNAEGVDLH